MKQILLLTTMVASLTSYAQINGYPYLESFEDPFTTGDNVEFITNWTGNEVGTSSRIFQSSDARTGSSALGVIPISSFTGRILLSVDMTGRSDGQISFYAKSGKNGSGTRPAVVFFATSVDGGSSFGPETQIGDDLTFPNVAGESYSMHSYDLNNEADNSNQVIVRIEVGRGSSGSGSTAVFLMDDVEITSTEIIDVDPPKVNQVTAVSSTDVEVLFNEVVDEITAEMISNYVLSGGVSILSSARDIANNALVHLTTSELTNGSFYTLTLNNIQDLSGNVLSPNTQRSFQYISPEQAFPGDIVINEFLASPSSDSSLPDEEFVELFNVSDKFFDLTNWTLSDANGTSNPFNSLILEPNEFLILTAVGNGSLFSSFGKVLEVSSFKSLNNDGDEIILRDNSSNVIVSISYSSSTPGVSSELVNPSDPCITELSYAPARNSSGGTPGNQNSVFDDSPDVVAPTVSSFNLTNSLRVNFSEVMDAESLASGSYSMDGLSIDQVIVEGPFPSSIELSFVEPISVGAIYLLTISDVFDCAGNELVKTSFNFGLGRSPGFNEIIISEIMFDPDPAVGLPEREYLEIHNPTADVLTTSGLSLTDATSTVDLPSFTLMPGDYYVLASTSAASEFSLNAVGVSGFPSLNNAGELLILSLNGAPIFSVHYDPDWHENSKREGGYSLEMKDVLNACGENENWGSSISADGGTPGGPNSITAPIPDNFGPEVTNVVALSPDTMRIDFNERISPESVLGASIRLEPVLLAESTVVDIQWPKSVFVILGQELIENDPVEVTVSNIFDCSGNEVQPNTTTFALPSVPQQGEILLSEVLFNPRSNGVDFVEVYNHSAKYLTLKGWKLARITESGIDDRSLITNDQIVLNPGEYLAITTEPEILLSNYPQGGTDQFFQVGTMPTYANDTGNVVLLNATEAPMDHFRYEDDFHYNLLESTDGVSLERISFSSPTNDPNNWRSAASTVGFATPGYANSQAIDRNTVSGKVKIDPEVFVPGNIGSGRDFTTINYQFSEPGKFANVLIYDQTGRLVKNLAEGVLLATSGFLRWDGTTNNGSLARIGYYVVFFEVYDGIGNSNAYKETVVVGRKF